MSAEILVEEKFIASCTEGASLYVRNKVANKIEKYCASRTVLFLHGATYAGSSCFDFAIDGFSWMDYLACHGFDVYSLDLVGYGASDKPKAFNLPPEENSALMRGETALKDIDIAVEHILSKRSIDSLVIVGWSWGSALAATYTTQYQEKVHKLVMYAPLWNFVESSNAGDSAEEIRLPAYRLVSKEETKQRWFNQIPENKQQEIIPVERFDQWADQIWGGDQAVQVENQDFVRAPNGVIQDAMETFLVGNGYYDPSKLQRPTLLVLGEWDGETPPDMAKRLFDLLENVEIKRMEVLPELTHNAVLERDRVKLFEVVEDFLIS